MGRALLTGGLELTFLARGWHFRKRGDLGVGDEFDAALELHEASLRPLAGLTAKSATHLEKNSYVVAGEIVFRGPTSFVLDFGVPAACSLELTREDLLPRDLVAGEIRLAWLDNWRPARERAAEEQWVRDLAAPSAPQISCEWRIERIWLQRTPWKELSPGVFSRDWEAGRTWAEIERTNWRVDDERHPEYFLECRLLRLPVGFATDRLKP